MPHFSKSTTSIIGASLMLMTVVVVLFWSFQQITEAADQRQHINQELDSANELLSSLKDAETGYRGYLLTGDEAFLSPYLLVRNTIVDQLRTLRKNTLIPAAQVHLDTMMPLVNEELAETARAIELRRHENASVSRTTINIAEGKRLMDSMREETNQFLQIEKIALNQREEQFQSKIRTMFGIIVISSLLAGILGIWFAYLKHQDGRHQLENLGHADTQRLLIALQKTNDELETTRMEAVNANNAKSRFLSNMSHELRTPLNAVLGFSQLMSIDFPPPSAAQLKHLDQIQKAGWHLLDLINDILDLTQIESGNVLLSMESVALSDVIGQCLQMVEPQAQERNVTLQVLRKSHQFAVFADQTRLKQCLLNLLSNAIKYNISGGKVVIECLLKAPGVIRVNISDTGDGLTAEKHAQLFQPFNRLGKEAGPEEGTGIGLVLTKRLMELMGGAIGADSMPGVGSVFWIEFRLAAVSEQPVQSSEIAVQPA